MGDVHYTGLIFEGDQAYENNSGRISFSGRECTLSSVTDGVVEQINAKFVVPLNVSSKDYGWQIVCSYDLVEASAVISHSHPTSSSVIKNFTGDVEMSWQKEEISDGLHQGMALANLFTEELEVEINVMFSINLSEGILLEW